MGKNQRLGAAWEQAVADYFKDHGFPHCERRVTNGAKDRGDLSGIIGVVIECKNEQRIDLSGYMDEVRVEKANAGVELGFAVIKRRNHGVDRAYVVMELRDLPPLIE